MVKTTSRGGKAAGDDVGEEAPAPHPFKMAIANKSEQPAKQWSRMSDPNLVAASLRRRGD